jgi:hypothetical protein
MMALGDAGGSMCEARFADVSIAKPDTILPPPSSRQGRRAPLLAGSAEFMQPAVQPPSVTR